MRAQLEELYDAARRNAEETENAAEASYSRQRRRLRAEASVLFATAKKIASGSERLTGKE
jgi:hypothetical protein